MERLLWFAASFGATLVSLIIGAALLDMGEPDVEPNVPASAVVLANLELPVSGIVSADTGKRVDDLESMIDDAVVVLLGSIGCAPSQVNVLRWFGERIRAKTDTSTVIAVYADPSLGLERGKNESLVLRRVSQVQFPFFVSVDTRLDLRSLRIPAPVVVRVRDGIVVDVVALPLGRSPDDQLRPFAHEI